MRRRRVRPYPHPLGRDTVAPLPRNKKAGDQGISPPAPGLINLPGSQYAFSVLANWPSVPLGN
jgi:hypothetical protein